MELEGERKGGKKKYIEKGGKREGEMDPTYIWYASI